MPSCCRLSADSPLRIRNVKVYLYITTVLLMIWSFSFASTFDAYLLELGKQKIGSGDKANVFVGSVESVRGIVSLVAAWPLGVLADRMNRRRMLQAGSLFGTLGVALLASGILADSVVLLYSGVVVSALFMQVFMGCGQCLLADSVPKESLTVVMAHQSSLYLLGYSVGPVAQIAVISVVGDSWSLGQLHIFLSVGFLLWPAVLVAFPLLRPTTQELERHSGNGELEERLATAGPPAEGGHSNGSADAAPLATTSCTEGAVDAQEPTATVAPCWYDHRVLGMRKKWLVPLLIELNSLVISMGAGMTVKFFPLFFKQDYHFSPIQLCSLNAGYTLAIAVFVQLCERASKRFGRCQAVLIWDGLGTMCLFLLWRLEPLPFVVIFHILRGSFMNASTPINEAIILECVDTQMRGRWSALQSISRFSWSGSAILGGLLADSHDYRYTFFITGLIYASAVVIYIPLLFLVPSKVDPPALSRRPTPEAVAVDGGGRESAGKDDHASSIVSLQPLEPRTSVASQGAQ